MNKTLGTALIVLAVLALAGGLFFFGTMVGRSSTLGSALPFGWRSNNYTYGPNQMMPGYGWNNGNGYGRGMMGTYSRNNGNGYGPGMMGNYGYSNTNLTPLTVDQAKAAAGKYLATLNNSDLAIAEVMVFSNNAYVAVKEISTGKGAFELLVDPASQIAYPEYGPNMMWNLKYGSLNHAGMMGGRGYGMMGGWINQSIVPADVSADMPVTSDQAIKDAQAYLETDLPGAVAADDPLQFYGYYTLDFSRDGKVAGMLSINGYTGQVFVHTWHGSFVEEAE